MARVSAAAVMQAMHKTRALPGAQQRGVRAAFREILRWARELDDPACAAFVRWQARDQFRRHKRVRSAQRQRDLLFGARSSADTVRDAAQGDRAALSLLMDHAYGRVGPLQAVLQHRIREVLLSEDQVPLLLPARPDPLLPDALERIVQLAVMDAKRIRASTSYAVPRGGLPHARADAPGVPHDRSEFATVPPDQLPGVPGGMRLRLARADARAAAMAAGRRRAPAERPPVPIDVLRKPMKGEDFSQAPLTRSERAFAHWYTEPLHLGHQGSGMQAPLSPSVQRMLVDHLAGADAGTKCAAPPTGATAPLTPARRQPYRRLGVEEEGGEEDGVDLSLADAMAALSRQREEDLRAAPPAEPAAEMALFADRFPAPWPVAVPYVRQGGPGVRHARAVRALRFAARLPFSSYGELVRLQAAALEKQADLAPHREGARRAGADAASIREALERWEAEQREVPSLGIMSGGNEHVPPHLKFRSLARMRKARRAIWNRMIILRARQRKENYMGWLTASHEALVDARMDSEPAGGEAGGAPADATPQRRGGKPARAKGKKGGAVAGSRR